MVQEKLLDIIDTVKNEEKIHVHLNTNISTVEGFVGNFKSTKPNEYLYGQDPRIITNLELDKKFMDDDPALADINTAVFIQCVGSREPDRPYCSRVCCTHSIDSALELKRRNPDMSIYILYRDIRTYGERELLYKKAREAGVIFILFSLENKPEVVVKDGAIKVRVIDHVLGRTIEIETDLLNLAAAIIPYKGEQLAQYFKVPLNEDGFFVERHAKLGPSEFATDGVFLCGLAHYPKPIDESVAQGKAAASRAVTLLAQEKIHAGGEVAGVNPAICSNCGVCVSICPYSAPSFLPEDARFFPGKAEINPALCKGCGLCVASCRSGAINLKGFDNDQIFAMIEAM